MFTCNDIGNSFFVVFNNISYNKLEVENIILKKIKIFLKKRRILFLSCRIINKLMMHFKSSCFSIRFSLTIY